MSARHMPTDPQRLLGRGAARLATPLPSMATVRLHGGDTTAACDRGVTVAVLAVCALAAAGAVWLMPTDRPWRVVVTVAVWTVCATVCGMTLSVALSAQAAGANSSSPRAWLLPLVPGPALLAGAALLRGVRAVLRWLP